MSPADVTVKVEFMGPVLRPRSQEREIELSLPAGATTDQLLEALGYRPMHARHVGVFREDIRLPKAAELYDGERLTIAVAMGGG